MCFLLPRGVWIVQFVMLCACAPTLRQSMLQEVSAHQFDRAMERYEMLRLDEGPDEELLTLVALSYLEALTIEGGPSGRDALRALIAAGTAGNATLRRLAAREDLDDELLRDIVRTLAARGDTDAQERLVQLGDTTPLPHQADVMGTVDALRLLAEQLDAPFSLESALKVARAINVLHGDDLGAETLAARERGLSRIAAGLGDPSKDVRGIAIMAARTLRNIAPLWIALLQRVNAEEDESLFLEVASLVVEHASGQDKEGLVARLAEISRQDSLEAAHASSLLCGMDDERGPARLRVLTQQHNLLVRMRAFFDLARVCGEVDAARAGLVDRDERVRLITARGIVAHASHTQFP